VKVERVFEQLLALSNRFPGFVNNLIITIIVLPHAPDDMLNFSYPIGVVFPGKFEPSSFKARIKRDRRVINRGLVSSSVILV
jgi:hypothetical protein